MPRLFKSLPMRLEMRLMRRMLSFCQVAVNQVSNLGGVF